MRLLLDTHSLLWWLTGDRRLKAEERRAISDPASMVYVSAATVWEIAIKVRLGKIEADTAELVAALDASGFLELPVSATHAAGVARLELHHNDPFDRLLISQALAEPLKLLTADEVLARYTDLVVLIGDVGRD